MFKLLHKIYIFLGYIIRPALWVFFQWRLLRKKEFKNRLKERYGKSQLQRPKGPVVWVHGASVGESLSALPLLEKIQKSYPDINILITSGSVSSARILKKRLPQGIIHQFIPVDIQSYINRFLNHWSPDIVLWLESELWPNHLLSLKNRKIPVLLINARLSPHSYKSWTSFKFIVKEILNCFSLCLASTKSVAKKLTALGAFPVKTPGNLKYAAKPLPVDEEAFLHLRKTLKNRPFWIAVSTHPDEEKVFIKAHKFLKKRIPDLLTIIIPRHPERGENIYKEITEEKLIGTLRSLDHLPTKKTDVYICDTLGELGLFFRLASVVVMGGSFVPVGGHNPLEPATFGVALVWGKYMFNFPEIEETFLKNGAALKAKNQKELNTFLLDLLTEEEKIKQLSISAKKVLKEQRNVLNNTMKYISPFIKELLKKYP